MECPKSFLRSPVTAGARLTLVALWTFASPGKLLVWPSVRRLCALTGFADRSVRRHLDELEQDGKITRAGVRKGAVIWVMTEMTTDREVMTEVSTPPDRDDHPPLTETPVPLTEMASPSDLTRTIPGPHHTHTAGARGPRLACARLAPVPDSPEVRLEVELSRLREGLMIGRRPPGLPVLYYLDDKARELLRAGATVAEILAGIEAFAAAIERGQESRNDWRSTYILSVAWFERIRIAYLSNGQAAVVESAVDRLRRLEGGT